MSSAKKYFDDKSILRFNNTILFFGLVILMLVTAWDRFTIHSYLNKQKTVIIPSAGSEPIEVVGNTITSKGYYEDWSRKIVNYGLNYHPATVRKQYDELLKFYDPEVFSDAKKQFYDYVDLVEKTESTSVFYIFNIVVRDGHEIEIDGVRKGTSKPPKAVSEEHYEKREKWLIKYKLTDLKFTILSFKALES